MTKERLEELNGGEIELKWKDRVRVKTAWAIWRLLLLSSVHIEGTEEEAKKHVVLSYFRRQFFPLFFAPSFPSIRNTRLLNARRY